VVANEVRALPSAAPTAKDIKALITTSNEQVSTGVALASSSGGALRQIVGEVADFRTGRTDRPSRPASVVQCRGNFGHGHVDG
jgi:hypothetical protein